MGLRVAVLASGRGSILEAMLLRDIPVTLVLTDRHCRALDVAEDAHVPCEMVPRTLWGYKRGAGDAWDRPGFTREAIAQLKGWQIDIVAMVGFYTVLSPRMFSDVNYGGRVLNTHPALLPLHPGNGEEAVRETLESGDGVTGPTVHIATEIPDDSRFIVAQRPVVPVLVGDTVTTLWERIKVVERELYPQVLQDILNGAIDLATIYNARH